MPYTFPKPEHPASTLSREQYSAAYKAVGGLHVRSFGSPWCEAGHCWGRVKTQEQRATRFLVRFMPRELDGGCWNLCDAHAAIIAPTSA